MISKHKLQFFTEGLFAVVTAGFSVLGFFSSDFSSEIRLVAVGIGGLVLIVWMISVVMRFLFPVITSLRQNRISADQKNRLHVLIEESCNHMSYQYVHSPFYIWHSAEGRYVGKVKMNYAYHDAVQSWLLDLKSAYDASRRDVSSLLQSFPMAISQAARCAKVAEQDLIALLSDTSFAEVDRKRLAREWDSAKNQFNGWLERWQTLFKEIDKWQGKASTTHYVRPLENIG